jgi:6-pyruvoyltetrahydropterin/6-carboxytetrahydropterin synthase
VALHSVIAHETDTGYAQCFRENAYNPRMGAFELEQVVFSECIQQEWHNPELFKQLLRGLPAHNPDLC